MIRNSRVDSFVVSYSSVRLSLDDFFGPLDGSLSMMGQRHGFHGVLCIISVAVDG